MLEQTALTTTDLLCLDPGILGFPISLIVACVLEEVVPGHVATKYGSSVLTMEMKQKLVADIRRFVDDMHDIMHLSKVSLLAVIYVL